MGIQVEIDDDNKITSINISFHTSSWGDSGLGEEDPEDYFDFSECKKAAFDFIDGLLK